MQPPWKRSPPPSEQPPLKIEVMSKLTFWKLGKGGGGHTMIYIYTYMFVIYIWHTYIVCLSYVHCMFTICLSRHEKLLWTLNRQSDKRKYFLRMVSLSWRKDQLRYFSWTILPPKLKKNNSNYYISHYSIYIPSTYCVCIRSNIFLRQNSLF